MHISNILVTGGAGYIGSHMTQILIDQGYKVIVVDNLSTGFKDAVHPSAHLLIGDVGDKHFMDSVFKENQIHAVMHFAAFISVGESVIKPEMYYQNNVVNTLNLLNTMLQHDVKCMIFSSSAAVYGNPQNIPIEVDHPKNPVNPYGETKLIIESILKNYDIAYGLKSISLRYFNACGADPNARMGERHDPETHLIPLVLQVASGKREFIRIYGNDYETIDGTCVRDYIHVLDICDAHLCALKKIDSLNVSTAYNIGTGVGYSVQQVIDVAKKITGHPIPIVISERRAGDPSILLASPGSIMNELGWSSKLSDLETILNHAWNWEKVSTKTFLLI